MFGLACLSRTRISSAACVQLRGGSPNKRSSWFPSSYKVSDPRRIWESIQNEGDMYISSGASVYGVTSVSKFNREF